MNISTCHPTRNERGAALITGLIFMVVLTLLAMAAMRTTLLEERMAGNARDVDLAFQAAEAALRAGEQVLNGATLPVFAVSGPYLTAAGINARGTDTYWMQTHNWATDSVAVSTVPAGVHAAPQYVIEQMPAIPGQGGSLKAGPLVESGIFRLTVRGTGGTPNTRVFLQETYQR